MKITSVNYFDGFFAWLRDQKGATGNTARAYRHALACFSAWWRDIYGSEPTPGDVTGIDLRDYQEYLQNVKRNRRGRPLKPATVKLYMEALQVFLKWAREAGHVGRLPNFPKAVQEQKGPPKALDRNEQNRLLREVERRGKNRDIALVRLLLSCGLRVSEAVSIKMADLDIGERHGVLTVRGKGNKYREVPVPPEARRAVRAWLEERGKKHPNSEYIFPGRNGGHVTARYVEHLIRDLGRFARLEIHPHVLRHTAATNMIETGADLVTVAQILGHSSLNATAIYTKPNVRRMAEALERGEA
ncbi:tyrosine-type recombinase/integrase [Desulfofundulus thermobenzoicus]|uniref:Tyrosine-type recombinase/integrase n=1 Tax=Desulfofundulus thermobenzoicus TaxID=29376 RepID=A0A6N7IU16_9FIRM|nr:tyrosine-type recombinase/integrase [Desulfofundulus thermobenzoicus]MQL53616.1 tyrosine-type recombinase/integrase [Desulfofundulus thermobenzoicus]